MKWLARSLDLQSLNYYLWAAVEKKLSWIDVFDGDIKQCTRRTVEVASTIEKGEILLATGQELMTSGILYSASWWISQTSLLSKCTNNCFL